MSAFVPEKQAQAAVLGHFLAQTVTEYFKNKEHRLEFEKWHMRKYGYAYEWKRGQS